MFKVNNKNTRTTPMASLWYLYCQLWIYFTSCSSISIVNFDHLIAGWAVAGRLLLSIYLAKKQLVFWRSLLIDEFFPQKRTSKILISNIKRKTKTWKIIKTWKFWSFDFNFTTNSAYIRPSKLFQLQVFICYPFYLHTNLL